MQSSPLTRLLALLLSLDLTAATPHPAPAPAPAPGLIGDLLGITDGILRPVLNIGALPPPTFLQTRKPSPECAAVNGGELQCCRGIVAGDIQLVVWLAKLYGYNLNPNDINGLNCDNNIAACPGVKVCCQVTALSPLVSLYCQDEN